MSEFEINDTSLTDQNLKMLKKDLFPEDKDFHLFVGRLFQSLEPQLQARGSIDAQAKQIVSQLCQLDLMSASDQIENLPQTFGLKQLMLDGNSHDLLLIQTRYEFSGLQFDSPPESDIGTIKEYHHLPPKEEPAESTIAMSVLFYPQSKTLSAVHFGGFIASDRYTGQRQPSYTLYFLQPNKPLETQINQPNGTNNSAIVSQDQSIITYTYTYSRTTVPDDLGRKFEQSLRYVQEYTDSRGNPYAIYIEDSNAAVET